MNRFKYFIYSSSGKMIAVMMAENDERADWFAKYKYGPEVRVERG